MTINTKDWARKIISKLPYEHGSAFEAFLRGTETFAEAATALIESLTKPESAADTLDRIKERIEDGEDAEAVVREETAKNPSPIQE